MMEIHFSGGSRMGCWRWEGECYVTSDEIACWEKYVKMKEYGPVGRFSYADQILYCSNSKTAKKYMCDGNSDCIMLKTFLKSKKSQIISC